jgi:hypothetical protein
VIFIRDNPQISGSALARQFGVAKGVICDIRKGRKWKHLLGER